MRVRSYISQSFALTIEQIEWLETKAQECSQTLGVRISMSELLRVMIDDYRNKQVGTNTSISVPTVAIIPEQSPHPPADKI
jgi:hypothetical protein